MGVELYVTAAGILAVLAFSFLTWRAVSQQRAMPTGPADNLPVESSLEETYYHRLNPAQGFAFQRVYTDDRSLDEAIQVRDGDVVLVPRGYHPVAAAPGYDLYYLNVMAGPTRLWAVGNDPDHEWTLVSEEHR